MPERPFFVHRNISIRNCKMCRVDVEARKLAYERVAEAAGENALCCNGLRRRAGQWQSLFSASPYI